MNVLKPFAVALAPIIGFSSIAEAREGVVIRCGASSGTGYFFRDPLTNPDGPNWQDDGISNGKIVLVRLGDEWDIQFDDTVGAYGYRQDGARVVPLNINSSLITIGAFAINYVDLYTFNLLTNEVLWTSHKTGTLVTKVALYRAECSS